MPPTNTLPPLTIETLCEEAGKFAIHTSQVDDAALYGVDNGKTIGTYLEHGFRESLVDRYSFQEGNSASGIDFPSLNVDVKVTSIRQPQSSSPFQSARQKIYGLGYGLLLFTYQKTDDVNTRTGRLTIEKVVYIEPYRTGDFQLTRSIKNTLDNQGNEDDLVALFSDRNLPVDDISARALAEEILRDPPPLGFVTISNALQWRLQYTHAIRNAGVIEGVHDLS